MLEKVYVFVTRIEEHEFPDLTLSLRYQFVHVLYQNALYTSLQPTRRVSLSRRVARALVVHHRNEHAGIAGRLAVALRGCPRVRDPARSSIWRALGTPTDSLRSARRFRLPNAAWSVLRGMPEGPERIQHELGLQMIRGLALRMMKGWASPEIEPVFARARELVPPAR